LSELTRMSLVISSNFVCRGRASEKCDSITFVAAAIAVIAALVLPCVYRVEGRWREAAVCLLWLTRSRFTFRERAIVLWASNRLSDLVAGKARKLRPTNHQQCLCERTEYGRWRLGPTSRSLLVIAHLRIPLSSRLIDDQLRVI